jgi:hypothetical protein
MRRRVCAYSGNPGKNGIDSLTPITAQLHCHPLGWNSQKDVEKALPLGNLVKETSDVSNYRFAGYHLPFQGDLVTKFSNGDPHGGLYTSACLHAEFEGGGVYDLLQSCKTALALATIAAAVCSIPVIGWIACLILSVAAAIITLTGISNALDDKGNPNDVNANLLPIHQAESPDGYGADILVVKGTWVYDSAHEGWNEIHPIKQCQWAGAMLNQQWKEIQVSRNPDVFQSITDINAYVQGWCALLATVTDPGTVANQQLPQNQWTIHPLVDGCQPAEPAPPPIK